VTAGYATDMRGDANRNLPVMQNAQHVYRFKAEFLNTEFESCRPTMHLLLRAGSLSASNQH
jgi:hypothetical protein